MGVKERLSCLRKLMEEKGIDFYVIPTADFHQSEYVGEYFKARKYMTGFSGSAGTAVISKDWAGMWTDGRYFIQAAKQMEGTTVELMKMREDVYKRQVRIFNEIDAHFRVFKANAAHFFMLLVSCFIIICFKCQMKFTFAKIICLRVFLKPGQFQFKITGIIA